MERSTARRGVTFTMKGKTQQHFRKEANINSIMAKYQRTGILVDPGIQMKRQPMFGMFEQFDFLQARNLIIQAERQFMALPAIIRKHFDNDPAQLIEFVQDEKNRPAAVAMGLIKEAETPPVQPVTPEPPAHPVPKNEPVMVPK